MYQSRAGESGPPSSSRNTGRVPKPPTSEARPVDGAFDPKAKRVESDTFDDASKTKLAQKEKSRSRWGGFSFLGAGMSAMSDTDDDDEDAGGLMAGPRRSAHTRRSAKSGLDSDDEGKASDGEGHSHQKMGRGGRREGGYWGGRPAELSADLRTEGLCDGLEIVGGDAAFEEQEDGDKALIVPEGAYVKVTMPAIPS